MFFIFPRVVSKKECEKLLEYCIKNTDFQEASMLQYGKADVDADDFGDEALAFPFDALDDTDDFFADVLVLPVDFFFALLTISLTFFSCA